jgi:hypothetical protein
MREPLIAAKPADIARSLSLTSLDFPSPPPFLDVRQKS